MTQGFPASDVLLFGAGYAFVAGCYSVHCKMFISILASTQQMLKATSQPIMTIKNVLRHCQMSLDSVAEG